MSLLLRIILFTIFAVWPVPVLFAQENIPDDAGPASEPDQTERIVKDRPVLYPIERKANPLTWLELAFKPAFRSAESGRIHRLMSQKSDTNKVRGVRFGVAGAGTGSGFGPQVTFFQKDFLGRRIDVEVPLLYTYSRYQVYQFNATVPISNRTRVDRLSFDLGAGYSSRARDDFFGIGNDSEREDERQFRWITRQASAGFTAKFDDHWTSRVQAVYRNVGITKPTFGFSAQDHFDDLSAPGLFGATLGSAVFSIARDTQVRENNSFKGGLDQFKVSFNRGMGEGNFQYWQYHFDSQHFFWLTDDGRKVIAVRGLLEANMTPAGHQMPFFAMPALGNFETLRGFENYRFRDKNALALTLEYRYRVWRAIDWGLFVDEGQVAPRLADVALNRFHTGYGVRLFVWPKPTLPISFDYGRSRESWRFYVNFNTSF